MRTHPCMAWSCMWASAMLHAVASYIVKPGHTETAASPQMPFCCLVKCRVAASIQLVDAPGFFCCLLEHYVAGFIRPDCHAGTHQDFCFGG